MKVLAVIPARGGSKGIQKNIVDICGKPLIAWTIEVAKKCFHIDRIVVSSDSSEILTVAEKYGAEKLKRPALLSEDSVRPEPVLEHALKIFIGKGYNPDLAVYLQPTSPLRTAEDLNKAFELFNNKKADTLISVMKADNKMLKAFIEKPIGFITGVSNNDFPFMPRQTLPPVYMPNGAIYIVKASNFLKILNFGQKNNTICNGER